MRRDSGQHFGFFSAISEWRARKGIVSDNNHCRRKAIHSEARAARFLPMSEDSRAPKPWRRRITMQSGSLAMVTRKEGPAVWQFRWSEKGLCGARVQRKGVIGTIERYPNESAARSAVI